VSRLLKTPLRFSRSARDVGARALRGADAHPPLPLLLLLLFAAVACDIPDVGEGEGEGEDEGEGYASTVFSTECPSILAGTPPFATGCYSPETSLDAVLLKPFVSGDWQLAVTDPEGGAVLLNSWRIDLCTVPGR